MKHYAVKIADRLVQFDDKLMAFYFAEKHGQSWGDIIDANKLLPMSRRGA